MIEDKTLLKKQMNLEIFQIAFHFATILSKYLLMFMLMVFYTYTIIKISTVTAIVYIVFLLFTIPLVMQIFIKQPEKELVYFPFLRKKYHYTIQNKQIQSYTMLFAYALLILWQKTFKPSLQIIHVYYYPTIILLISVFFRLLATIWYYFYIKNRLATGRIH